MRAHNQLRRSTVAAALLTGITLLAAACGSGGSGDGSTGAGSDSAGTSAKAGNVKVAAVIKGLDNPFFQAMEQGIKDEAKSTAAQTTIQAANSITDTTGQADKLTALAGQDYNCYIVNPISGTNLIQGVAQLAAKGKTIVNIDSPIDTKAAKAADATPATYIGTDNTAAGALAGKQMNKLLPSGGQVAVVGGTSGDVTSGARVTGFTDGLSSNVHLVQTVAANWDRQEALTQAANILHAKPNLKGFFVANDDMALGVARAVANAGKTGKVHIISVDGIPDGLKAVEAGQLDATVAQYPYAIGSMGLQACEAAAAGKTLPANVKAPVALVTKADASKALAAAPKPFKPYTNPLTELLK